jgi:SAM-dependent methyltransferase
LEASLQAPLVKQIATIVLALIAVIVVARQCRKPAWWPGRLFLWIMNRSHAKLTDWGLQYVRIEPRFTILDVGCGGGRTVDRLAGMATDGRVYGIDYSAASVAAARGTNARWIAAGRVDIRQGTVSRLPFTDGSFDIVSAVETHYYWPDPVSDFREILRVLKPGGRLVLIAEAVKGHGFNPALAVAMKLLRARYLSIDEHRQLLTAAGYAGVKLFEEPTRGWICAVATKGA